MGFPRWQMWGFIPINLSWHEEKILLVENVQRMKKHLEIREPASKVDAKRN
jgi:hypothetical protein